MEHIEGQQSVLAALEARQRRISVILVRQGTHPARVVDLLRLAGDCGVPIRHVEPAELDALAHGTTHGGIIAVCSSKPRLSPAALLELVDRLREPPLLLLLEGVDDARNLAFTLRTADAMGVHAVLIKKHLWDFDPVEVSRPSSGAYERLPLARVEGVELLIELKRRGVRIFGCLAAARRRLHERDLTQPCLIAIGGEKRGLSGAVRAVCDRFMSIATRGGPSSLSLSHAAAIALAEACRQRAAPPASEG
ncbi:MAG: 23S rRNA (guanosine-2'-O-)-methyltransferase RlmB [Phycisphaerae bacterium]|nr:23S rRNA (guanosine-2'-O-)-methyltransferase RlmB [Phycisphaerae bacterium]